jgi:hypothetical protein
MSGSRPPGVALSNWDLGGEPSAWAYRHAGELFPAVEIPVAGSGWAGVRGTDVLAMASGIDCLEVDVPGGRRLAVALG